MASQRDSLSPASLAVLATGVFLSGAAVMVYEFLAFRFLQRHFGQRDFRCAAGGRFFHKYLGVDSGFYKFLLMGCVRRSAHAEAGE